MKILIFTDGTILMFKSGYGKTREEIVEQSRKEGIQREEAALEFESKTAVPVDKSSVYDFANYIPIGNAVDKIRSWKKQGATIYYFTSRKIRTEVDAVKNVLKKYDFPDFKNLLFRKQGEDYKDIAEKLRPDILIEDDCESIGGAKEMTYPFIKNSIKRRIKFIVVKEFGGIDYLPDNLKHLMM